jgi:hypothetical protein
MHDQAAGSRCFHPDDLGLAWQNSYEKLGLMLSTIHSLSSSPDDPDVAAVKLFADSHYCQ